MRAEVRVSKCEAEERLAVSGSWKTTKKGEKIKRRVIQHYNEMEGADNEKIT
jgi:hypothetical protein